MSGPTAVVIPCLGLQQRLDALLRALPASVEVFVVDDGSPQPLRASRGQLLRHPRNRGYGAAQKTGYAAALQSGARRIVLLHGDGQYDPGDTLALAGALDEAAVALGSRFLPPAATGVPAWRSLGIRGLTSLANLRFGASFSDLHNGARAFRASALQGAPLERFSDDYRFDHQLLCWLLRAGADICQRPVAMSYEPGVLSISFPRALRYGLGCLVDLSRS